MFSSTDVAQRDQTVLEIIQLVHVEIERKVLPRLGRFHEMKELAAGNFEQTRKIDAPGAVALADLAAIWREINDLWEMLGPESQAMCLQVDAIFDQCGLNQVYAA